MNTHLMIRNIPHAEILNLDKHVSCSPGKIDRRSIAKNNFVKVFLFGFGINSELTTHTTNGDALVQVLQGTSRIVIKDQTYILNKGESIVLPADIPHSVHADQHFIMLLTIIHPLPLAQDKA